MTPILKNALAALSGAALLAPAWSQTPPLESLPRLPPLRAAAPAESVTCLVEPYLITEVGSPIDGILEKVNVDRGDLVTAGQVVARLKSGVEEAELVVKRTKVEFGRRKNERNEDLFRKQLISAQEKDEMETEYKLSLAELNREAENLKLRTILSPLTGVVVERYLWSGELIRADKSKVVKLAQLDPLKVEVVAPLALFGSVQVGAMADVALDPLVKSSHKAKVVIVDRIVDAASATFGIRLELPNPGYRIPAGIRCKVKFAAR